MNSKLSLSTSACLLLVCSLFFACSRSFTQSAPLRAGSGAGHWFTISGQHAAYRISPSNQISTVLVPVQGLSQSLHGSFGPAISPDEHWIAYLKGYDIWLFDTRTLQNVRVTRVGRDYGKKYASVEPLIVGWSPDSRQILFHLTPGETSCGDCDRLDWEVWPGVDYGYYRLDLRDNSIQKLSIPKEFEFRAWLPDGRILGTIRKGDRCGEDVPSGCGILVAWRPDATLQPASTRFGNFGQLDSSRDGSFAVFGDHNPAWSDRSQILKIDLSTASVSEISPKGTYAEYQWPRLSADAKHISWVRRYSVVPDDHKIRGKLIVDGAEAVTCGDFPRFEWLDNDRLAGICNGDLRVLDRIGRELGRASLPKDN